MVEVTVKLKGRGSKEALLQKFREFLYSAEESLVDGLDVEDADQLVKDLVLEFEGQDHVLDGYEKDDDE